jgi:hypothetical protein
MDYATRVVGWFEEHMAAKPMSAAKAKKTAKSGA